jgi:hypothetical protein
LSNEHSEPPLAEQIMGMFQESLFDDRPREFLPNGCIFGLITEKRILRAMPILEPQTPKGKELLNFILHKAKTVFTIAIFSGLETSRLLDAAKGFKKHDFHDRSLPIDRIITSGKDNPKAFPHKTWSALSLRNFYYHQWEFLVPVFSKTKFRYNFSPDTIMPFIWVSPTVKEGAFSQVFEVKIHPSHQYDPTQTVLAQRKFAMCW